MVHINIGFMVQNCILNEPQVITTQHFLAQLYQAFAIDTVNNWSKIPYIESVLKIKQCPWK